MKLAIASLMLLAATAAIALPTPEQAQPNGCVDSEVDGVIQKRCPIPWTKNYGEYDDAE